MKFPKYLVEVDFPGHGEGMMGWWPTRPLWVARTRAPFCLARFNLADENRVTFNFWPPVIDGNRRSLKDELAHALFRDFDIFPGDFNEPFEAKEIMEPPEFIHMIRPRSEAEFILVPREPLLYRVRLDASLDTSGIEWVQGFGRPPKFPEDLRAAARFAKNL